jgi:hypothetical protein
MAYEKKPGDMILFIKDNPQNKRPNMTGTIFIDGVEKEFALWERKSAAGNKFYSGSLKLTGETKPTSASSPFNKPAPSHPSFDDDIPF